MRGSQQDKFFIFFLLLLLLLLLKLRPEVSQQVHRASSETSSHREDFLPSNAKNVDLPSDGSRTYRTTSRLSTLRLDEFCQVCGENVKFA